MSRTAQEMLEQLRREQGAANSVPDARAVLNQLRQTQGPETSTAGAFVRGAGSRFLDNLLGIPDLALTAGARMLTGRPLIDRHISIPGVSPEEEQRRNTPLLNLPPVGARVLPLPRGEDIIPTAQARAEHPVATTLGTLGGEAATLLTGRAPLVRSAARRVGSINPRAGVLPRSAAPNFARPGYRRVLDRALQSGAMQGIARAAGRSTEAGFEGAVLAALQEGDPVQTAAYSSAAQLAGSAALGGAKGLLGPTVTTAGGRLAAAAIAATALHQVIKSATPGGRDRILESVEAGFENVKWAMVLGALAGAAGAGRVKSDNLPILADALSTVPRGVTLSLLRDAADDEDAARTLEHLATTPDTFSARQRRRLELAIRNGNFGSTIKRMIERDDEFAQMIDAPVGLADVPVTDGKD